MGEGPYNAGASRRHIRNGVEASLRRLGTDWIDLYQIHVPDADTPIEETLSALDDLVREGKVRYIGCSNFSGWQIADADWTSYIHHLSRFISAQNEYSLLNRAAEAEVAPACEHFGLGLIPYFPLMRGLLTGRYRRGETPPEGGRLSGPAGDGLLTDANFDIVEGLSAYARRKGTDLLGVAIGGLLAQPAVVSVIAGASQPDQVLANVAAAEWEPGPEDLEELDEIAPPRRPAGE
jgi:aryl-alcohol dehydrogenase-like predicted oxidoreductase